MTNLEELFLITAKRNPSNVVHDVAILDVWKRVSDYFCSNLDFECEGSSINLDKLDGAAYIDNLVEYLKNVLGKTNSTTIKGSVIMTNASRDPYGEGKQYNPSLNGQEIIAARIDKETKGITAFKLEDGTEFSYDEAIQAIQSGNSEGLTIQNNAYGPYIKSLPDGDTGNNLDSLPTF